MKNVKKYYVIALMQSEAYTNEVKEIAWLKGFNWNTGAPEYVSAGSRLAFASDDHMGKKYCNLYERLRIYVNNELEESYFVELKEIEVKEEKEEDEQIMIENKTNNSIIVNDFSEAYEELRQSYELEEFIYDVEAVECYYNERTKAAKSFEGSWKFQSNNHKQYEAFKREFIDYVNFQYRNDNIERSEYIELTNFINKITLIEFMTNKKDGVKLGKLLKRKGFKQSLLDYYSALDRKKEELYITISGAPQVVAGMSNHGEGWASCQATYDGGGHYNKHLIGSLTDSRLLVIMITREPLTEFTSEMGDVVLARSCAHVFNYEDKNILVPVGCYSSSYHKAMTEGVEHLQGLGLRVSLPQTGYDGELLKSSAEVANISQDAYYYVEVDEEVDVTCECPLCSGHGEISAYIGDSEQDIDVDCPLCGGSGEYETTVYINETFEDSEEVESTIGSYEENSLSYRRGEIDGYYGNYKTMRINYNQLKKLMSI